MLAAGHPWPSAAFSVSRRPPSASATRQQPPVRTAPPLARKKATGLAVLDDPESLNLARQTALSQGSGRGVSMRQFADALGRWQVVDSVQPPDAEISRLNASKTWRSSVDHSTRCPYTSGTRTYTQFRTGDRVRLLNDPSWPPMDPEAELTARAVVNEKADTRIAGDKFEEYCLESHLPRVTRGHIGKVVGVNLPLRQVEVDFGFGLRRRSGKDGSLANNEVAVGIMSIEPEDDQVCTSVRCRCSCHRRRRHWRRNSLG